MPDITHSRTRSILCGAGLLLAAAAQAQSPAPAAAEAGAGAHVANARRLAADDLKPLLTFCQAAPAERPPLDAVARFVDQQIARPAPPPVKVFDNLSYVGSAFVSAWALHSSDGIVMLDALNTPAEAAQLIDGGLRALGHDPAQIRQVLVTHAHGDHYGGMPHLKDRHGAKLAMSEVDWRMSATQLEFAIPIWLPPPRFDAAAGDRALRDGDTLTQGDATLTVYLTPGHTMGTLSAVLEVRDGPRRHKALIWGGTAFIFDRDLPRLDAYIAATQRMARLAAEQGIDVMLSNHPGYDATVAKVQQMKGRASGADSPHPFVIGADAVVRSLNVMGECAQAQRLRFSG